MSDSYVTYPLSVPLLDCPPIMEVTNTLLKYISVLYTCEQCTMIIHRNGFGGIFFATDATL